MKLNDMWNKTIPLIETNCHLHPLDSIATIVKNMMAKYQNPEHVECLAATTIHKLSKLRFKDSKGDPKGFMMFLTNKKLPLSILPRYVGNRLNILFVTAEVLTVHRGSILEYLDTVTCEKFKKEIKRYFENGKSFIFILIHIVHYIYIQLHF